MSGITILSYRFGGGLSSRDGSHPLQGVPGTIVPGPGVTALGECPKAMHFAGTSHLSTTVSAAEIPARSFTVRMHVRPAVGAGSELLVRCESVPFQLMLTAGDAPEQRGLLGTILAQAHGGQGIQTLMAGVSLQPDRWYQLDLVYAYDTLGVFVDGILVHPFGLADGRLAVQPTGRLLIGGDPENAAPRFQGSIAALEVLSGAPVELARQLEQRRAGWLWHLTHHYTLIDGRTRLGRSVAKPERDEASGALRVRFERGMISFNRRLGAFALDGDLYRGYTALSDTIRRELGKQTSDPITVDRPACRYARFEGGAVLHSARTGTVAVPGRIFQHWIKNGGPRGFAGLPMRNATRVTGGLEQVFQRARYYDHFASEQAFEVRGGILNKFLGSGGIGRCGFPQSDESPVFRDGVQVGARADFTKCSIFHSEPRQTHVVESGFLAVLAAHGGVEGDLGLPTGDPVTTGFGTGAFLVTYQTFERGTMVHLPYVRPEPYVCLAFQVFLKRLDTHESEGIAMGENDVYFHLGLHRGQYGHDEDTLHEQRYPPFGTYAEGNVVELDETLPPVLETTDPDVVYRLRAEVWDSDSGFGGDDSFLGDVQYEFSLWNAWGQAVNGGLITAADRKASFSLSVKPQFMRENYSIPEWNFFSFDNDPVSIIPWRSFATAFAGDIDEDLSFDDILLDPVAALYGRLVYLAAKHLGKLGMCWGYAVEAMQAWNGTSLFSPPLSRYTREQAEGEIAVKHVSQLGVDRLKWHAARFAGRKTQNAVQLFKDSRAAVVPGGFPLLVVIKDEFVLPSVNLHVVLPFEWDDSSYPWEIKAYDSNLPGAVRPIRIWPDQNRWEMETNSSQEEDWYRGGGGTGSRIFHVPWSIAGNIPARLPSLRDLEDVLKLLGLSLIWDLLEFVGIVDTSGQEMDGTRATAADKNRLRYMMWPVPFQGVPGGPQMWVRRVDTESVNYVHDLKVGAGVRPGRPWTYAVSFGGGELCYVGGGDPGDRLRLRFESLGWLHSRSEVTSTGGGTFTAVYTARLGEDGSQARMVLYDLPLGPEPVRFSWEPGMEGFEVFVPGRRTVPLMLTCHQNGVSTVRRYRLKVEGGCRVRISSAVATGELLVYGLQAVNGVHWGEQVLMPEPEGTAAPVAVAVHALFAAPEGAEEAEPAAVPA